MRNFTARTIRTRQASWGSPVAITRRSAGCRPSCEPRSLSAESQGAHRWRDRRAQSDFSLLEPHLAAQEEPKNRSIQRFPDAEHFDDPLLDDHEPGMKTAEAAAVLEELKSGLLPLSNAIAKRADSVDDSVLEGHFPLERQRADRRPRRPATDRGRLVSGSTRPRIRSCPTSPHMTSGSSTPCSVCTATVAIDCIATATPSALRTWCWVAREISWASPADRSEIVGDLLEALAGLDGHPVAGSPPPGCPAPSRRSPPGSRPARS